MAQHFGLRRIAPPPPDVSHASKELLIAAERDAGDIVAAARTEVQRTILKAQQELLALNAQVRTTIERLEGHTAMLSGRSEGTASDASRLLREASAQLDALSIEPRATGVVVAHPAAQTPITPALALSPYEMDTARVRVRVSARAARSVRVAPVAAVLVAVTLFAGAWAWTHGSMPRGFQAGVPRFLTATPAASGTDNVTNAGTTGMIGRADTSRARGDQPERDTPRTPAPRPAASPALSNRLPPESTSPAARQELLTAATRWLDAYYLKDSGRLAALSTAAATLSDERKDEERLPSGLAGVQRTLSDPTVQVFGSDAIMTAKIIERSDSAGREAASFISQMWTRRGGAWQVTDVRIVSAEAVARAFRR